MVGGTVVSSHGLTVAACTGCDDRMDLGISGKLALVCGASRGLGLASAKALAAEGCRVAISGRDVGRVERAVAELGEGAVGIVADTSTPEGIAACAKPLDGAEPDILVLNAGGPPSGSVLEMAPEQWEAAHASLLSGMRLLCERFLPAMRARRWGRIVAITSRTVLEPDDALGLSNVYRTALTAYLKSLSRLVAADGVTVNAVMPGAIYTDRLREIFAARAAKTGGDAEAVARAARAALPSGEFQKAEDFGAAVAFLASERAGSITGVSVPVDGGAIRFVFA